MLSVISIIIVNYNQERYLRKAIESVLEQTKRDWDLLIWDDGSTDNSVTIAREYEQQDDRIRVIAAQHQGVAKARKQAIAETRGNYFGYIDSDDWIANTTLEETARLLDSNPEVGMVYTDYYDVNSRGKVLGKGKRCYIPYSPQRLLVDFMTFHFRLLRREVYRQIEEINFNCEYADDYDLCLCLSEITKFKRIQKPLYYYRHHGRNISYCKRKEQIRSSQIAVNRALQRRGLADSYILKVEGDRFCLRQKAEGRSRDVPWKVCTEGRSQKAEVSMIAQSFDTLVSGTKLLQTAATLVTILPLTTAIGFAGSFCEIAVNPASAQNIIPNNDGTMTIVTEDGNSFNIDGGTLSGDGKNLFHSFQEFGLDAGQIANFLSNPNIQNILGRINGGNPSIINGLIQVTGGNSNLFLMNPSGIIFGNNASLNVPGDFTATTATGIGFGDGWFNAVGVNDYLNLGGNPDSFNFSDAESGVIINSGDLQVANDSNISLNGSTVINTGTIETEGGNITVAAVPGTNRVRISQEGQLLSLEVPIPHNANGEALPIRVVDLPNLLRGLPVDIDTGLEVAANNDVTVANSDTVIPNEPGTTIVSGTIDASNTGGMGGEVHILGDKVGLIGADIDASGDIGGGEVLVGGDYKGEGAVPNADVTLVDRDSTIKADAWQNGNGGKVIVWSDNTTRVYGEISAKGGLNFGNGGFVETSSAGFLDIQNTPDVSAFNGISGTWLIDPHNISITDLDEVDNNIGTESPFVATGDDVNLWVGFIEQALQDGTEVIVSTGTTGNQAGDITLEADLDFNGTGNSTLTLEAANDIVIGEGFGYGGGILDSNLDSPDALNLLLNADSDESGLGRVEINEPIATGGGDININGRSNNNNTGVLVNSNINSGGGDITITGTSTGDDGGLFGVSINNSQITADDGAISITGVSDNVGVQIDASSLTTTNNIILTGDEIVLTNEATLNADNVTLQPVNPEVNIAIASGETLPPTLDIAQTELDTIEANSLTIGDAINGTGTITIDNPVTFDESVTLATPSGTIQVDGAIAGIDNASVTLNSSQTNLNADITTQGQPIEINDNVILGTGVTLDTTEESFAGANITIDGTINSFNDPESFPNDLILNSGTGEINITGAIGDTNPLGFIDANSSSTTNFGSTINADNLSTDADGITILNGNVTTTLGQFYGDAVELGQNIEIATGNGYGVTFNSTVRSPNTPRSLTITTTGDEFSDEDITFNGAVGDNNQPLLSLETNTDTGITSINGGLVITTENQTHNTDISIGNFDTDTQLIADSDNNGSGAFSAQNIDGDGQNLSIQAGSINTGNIDNNFGGDEGGTGNINLSSPGNITTGYIDSAGNILIDSNGDSDNTQGLFTSTATLPETNISITGTTVTIEHGGGNTNPGTPFIVGDATNNGTAGDIISATETVAAEEIFPDTFISDNETIQIITPDAPIELPIVPAEDGTGSIVTAQEDGVTFDLTGGLTSDDEQNLFHSFIRFDLPESIQTANLVANDSLDNILARVSSGDASELQGTIQVTGGNPNLFLINPAGIIFGSTAQINVPAAFTATTGNGLGFGDDWFSASGAFTPLNGTPDTIALTSTNPGAIINDANLTNNNGTLNLVGGTIVNSGDVTSNGFSAIALNEGASIVNLSDFSITSTEGVTSLPNDFTADILTFDEGISISDSNITSTDGNISLIGRIGNISDNDNNGIEILGNSIVESTGIGNINLQGTGGNGNERNHGIQLQESARIISQSGEITLDGTGGNGVANNRGVSIIDSSIITSTDGNINLIGTGGGNGTGASNVGIFIDNGSLIESTGIGNITLNGTGGNGTVNNRGIELQGASNPNINRSVIRTNDGNINLTGTGNGIENFNIGIFLNNGGVVESNGTGNISLTGTGVNDAAGIRLEDDSSIIGNGDITLTADEISLLLLQGTVSPQIMGNGTLRLQPLTPSLGITIGGTTNDSRLNLEPNEIATIQDGFSQTLIGREDGTGTLTVVDNVFFTDPVTLQADRIKVNGLVEGRADASITLIGAGTTTILNGDITTQGQPIEINDNVILTTGVNLNTTEEGFAGASITIDGTVNSFNDSESLTNDLTLTAGTGEINITGAIGDTNPLGDITANSSSLTNFGTTVNVGSLTTDANGTTQLNGNVTTIGNQTFNDDIETSENIELNAANGDISTQNITTAGTNLNITANEISTQNITTQGGSVDLQSTTGAIATEDINSSGATGGEINLDSATTITTQDLDSRGIDGEGGDVTLNSGDNEDIRVGSIRADSNNNNGGDIQVNVDNDNPGLFFAANSFPLDSVETSILTNSSSPEGITIRHGGKGEIPFEVANPELLEQDNPNGTVGAIIAGNNQINNESFLFTERRENITIISDDAPDNNALGNFEAESSSNLIQSFETAANSTLPPQIAVPSISEARKILRQIEQQAAQKPALVYISFTSPEIQAGTSNPDEYFARAETCLTSEYQEALGLTGTPLQPTICLAAQPSDRLEILVVTPEGEPIFVPVDVTRAEIEKQSEDLYREVANREELWQEPAELLYEWLISSIEEQLETREIDNLLFILPPKLRSLPLAALYDFDTDRFLVEKGYNIGLAPSINLMNTTYNKDVQTASVLALGASNFEADQNQQVLNAVEVELPQIVNLRGGKAPLINEQFTLENLQSSLDENNFPIVHLSTHADFSTASIDDIYIQLYNRRLTLDELRSLNLRVGSNDLELLVLSACRSAFGDTDAELGFAGLAVKLGVKTAIGSLWKVSDISTPGLMIEFYNQLKTSSFKAEALRLAQVAIIEEQVQIDLDNRQMITSWGEAIELPENVVADLLASNITEIDLSHPYYWAPFTVIGSPW